jgi:hypothetical protein
MEDLRTFITQSHEVRVNVPVSHPVAVPWKPGNTLT